MAFQQKFAIYRKRLNSIGNNEPLAKFSLLLILLLDVFIFSMILSGIEDNTKTIATPDSYASYQCRYIIDELSRLDKYESAPIAVTQIENPYNYRSSYYGGDSGYGYGDINGTSEACQKLGGLFANAATNNAITAEIKSLRDIQKAISWAETEKSTIQSSYDTMLLEKIANQKEDRSLTPESADTAKQKIEWINQKLADLHNQERAKLDLILAQPTLAEIYSTVATLGPTTMETYGKLEFWYPVKTFGAQILFILPLLAITLIWSSASVRKERGIQTLISSHLLAILSIFILLKVIQLIYDILPHAFLKKILDFLESWNIIGLWYYFLILLAIVATMWLVYLVQKKIFSKERLRAKRADRGECVECSARLLAGSDYCIRCGAEQFLKCPHCKKDVSVTATYCGHCGKEMA